MATTTTSSNSPAPRYASPELNDNINRVITMLQSGIGVEDEGTRYNDLKQLERQVMADVKSGKLPPEKAFAIAAEVRRTLTNEALQRFDEYFNAKNARQNLNTLIDEAVDGRATAQSSARLGRQMQTTIANLRTFSGSPEELVEARRHVDELEGRGTLDPIGAVAMRQAIDARLGEMVGEGQLNIAPPTPVWNAFIDSHAQQESARNMSLRAIAEKPRDVLLDPARFEPTLRATLRTGDIALSELGRLSAEAGEAQRRGTLSAEGRRSINQAIDSGIKNSAGVLDPAASVPRSTALAAARESDVVRRTLGATPRTTIVESSSGPTAEAAQREARSRLVTPVSVAPSQMGVSVAARAIDNTQRPTAPRPATNEAEKERNRSFDFQDPEIAKQFVRALNGHGKVSLGQRTALLDSVLRAGAMSLGELRAFQIALDDAATMGLVTREESQNAWKVVATEAAKHVGGSTVGAKIRGEEIARTGMQRLRG